MCYKVFPFCSYAHLLVLVQLLKTFPETFRWEGPHCGHRSSLNFLTLSFEKTFAEHIGISLYTWCKMCNVSLSHFSKRWKNWIFASCSSNALSAFDKGKWLQFTDAQYKKTALWILLLPYHITCHMCFYATVKKVFPSPNQSWRYSHTLRTFSF